MRIRHARVTLIRSQQQPVVSSDHYAYTSSYVSMSKLLESGEKGCVTSIGLQMPISVMQTRANAVLRSLSIRRKKKEKTNE